MNHNSGVSLLIRVILGLGLLSFNDGVFFH